MPIPASYYNAILASLAQRHLLRQAHLLSPAEHQYLRGREVVNAIAGQVLISGKEVELCVGVQASFPRSLPIVFLRPPDALGFIPHLDNDGYVCYAETEGMLLNTADPVGILREATERSLAVLRVGTSGANRMDFMDEFLLYWQRVSVNTLPAYIVADDQLRKVFVYSSKSGYEFVADSIETARAYWNGQRRELDTLIRRSALYVPLKEGTFIIPPSPQQLWNIQTVKKLVRENLSRENRQQLAHLGKKYKPKEFVLLGLPRPSEDITLIGLEFSNVVRGYPLLSGNTLDSLVPFNIQRRDFVYLLSRGGGRSNLRAFRVLLAGCGSVGGYVALGLVQAGIAHLTLVDPDVFRLENTFRHFLGMKAKNCAKVTALQEELESKYPYLSVKAYQTTIEEAIQNGLIQLPNFDLVIVAIGAPTVELYLNSLFHKKNQPPLTVFTWLEPYGIGGHAILSHPGQAGCLQCLFTLASHPDTPLYNRSAFAAYGQSFSKDDLGCGSSYTPFGALDAQKTAEQAVRLALDGLTGRELSNPILSWKGRADDFVAAGFQVSPRYEQTTEQLYEHRYDYIKLDCSVCATGEG